MDREVRESEALAVMENEASEGSRQERRPLEVKIVEHLCVFQSNSSGWTKELNIVSWAGNAPKFDIREWSPDHTKMSKGVTLSGAEAETLLGCLKRKGVGSQDGAEAF